VRPLVIAPCGAASFALKVAGVDAVSLEYVVERLPSIPRSQGRRAIVLEPSNLDGAVLACGVADRLELYLSDAHLGAPAR